MIKVHCSYQCSAVESAEIISTETWVFPYPMSITIIKSVKKCMTTQTPTQNLPEPAVSYKSAETNWFSDCWLKSFVAITESYSVTFSFPKKRQSKKLLKSQASSLQGGAKTGILRHEILTGPSETTLRCNHLNPSGYHFTFRWMICSSLKLYRRNTCLISQVYH